MARTEDPTAASDRLDVPLSPVLVESAPEGLRCLSCARRCLLREDGIGFCTAIRMRDGWLHSTAYGVVAEASVTPIESKPIYHFAPGARVLSLGGLGCNLRCRFCQNWEIAFRDARDAGGVDRPNLPPERAVEQALARGCQGIAWTFNEPTIWPMYVYDTARLARAEGLFTVYVTNGLLTEQTLTLLGPWLSIYRVDVKSLDAEFYAHIGATTRIQDVIPLARRAWVEFGIHVEVVTNLMPGLNDSDEHLKRLAGALIAALGEDTPWHLTSYVPYAFMKHVAPTPPATLARAVRIGRSAGLRFVYTDSIEAPETANTCCPRCARVVIERIAQHVTLGNVTPDGHCGACGEWLNVVPWPAGACIETEVVP